jgi:hypothetical protein
VPDVERKSKNEDYTLINYAGSQKNALEMTLVRRPAIAAVIAAIAVAATACDSGPREHQTTRADTTSISSVANAPPTTPNFVVARTDLELDAECRPNPVRQLAVAMLTAFNRGKGATFADGFAKPLFHPYSFRIAGSGFTDKDSISQFVTERHKAGDGWSATKLWPPTGQAGLPYQAVYGLDLRISQHGKLIRRGGAKLVIDCATGLLATWVGPAYGPTDVQER